MGAQTELSPVVLRAGEGEKRWFFGGGVWTWKTSPVAGADLLVWEVEMEGGKRTPLHTHPIAESLWVLEGELRYRIDQVDHEVGAGGFVMVPPEVPHAFLVVSDTARVVGIQPGSEAMAFYLDASEPLEGSARETDFDRIRESGVRNGGFTFLGPPPF